MFVTEPFQAYLAAPLQPTDVTLTLAQPAYADLLKLLDDPKSYTYLSIKDDVEFETVKAYARGGYIVIDRGQAGTKPARLAFAACVSTLTPTAVAVIHGVLEDALGECAWHYNPFADGGKLGIAFTDLPEGKVGVPWVGRIVLSGTLPVDIDVTGAPPWMTVIKHDNMVEMMGTPTNTATTSINLHAKNKQEDLEINQKFSITVC